MKFRLFLIVFQFFALNAYSNWFGGGAISVQNLGPDSFEVMLNISVDCASNRNDSVAVVNVHSSCGQAFSLTLNRNFYSVDGGQCPGLSRCHRSNPCDIPYSTLPGYRTFWFKNTVVLRPACDSWSIDYVVNESSGLNLINAQDSGALIRTKINTLDFPGNSSPVNTVSLFANICKGYPVSYNTGATDPDGDSLSYKFVCMKKDSVHCETYRPGYTAQEPIPGITLDSVTGQINFNTPLMEHFGLGIQITEYDRTGSVKGERLIEVHFRGEDCSNSAPVDTLGILNFQGDGTLSSNNVIEGLCLGDSFSFDVLIWDPEFFLNDTFDTLLITSNLQGVLPYSSFHINPVNDSFHIVSIAWRVVPTGTQTQSFFIQTSDDACPIPGFTTSIYTIKTKHSLSPKPDRTICRGDTLGFADAGAGALTWKSLYGDSIIPGQNFSCDSACQRAKLWPQNTTLYAVEGDLQNGCDQKDTFKVVVADDFHLIPKPDFEFCYGTDSVDLWVRAIPDSVNYQFKWPNAYDSSITRAKLYRTWGFNDFQVRVTNDSGCVKQAKVRANLRLPYPEIVGPEKAFRNETEEYRASGTPGSSYEWFVQGATIDSSNGELVFVRFADTSHARIGIIETDTMACKNNKRWKEIQLIYLGIDEAEEVFRLYPNPAVDKVFVESTQGLSKLRLYSVRGELLEEHRPQTGYYQLDIAPYAAGIYFLSVETKDSFKSFRLKKH